MPEDYRAKGQQFLQMASEATDSVAATLLRMLADDYFDLAEKEVAPAAQQQQQIQPKKPEGQET
jgi:hypothetical protein